MREEELNEERALWAGFTLEATGVNREVPVWIEPGGSIPITPFDYYFGGKNYGCPDFPSSLDLCFKHLVPLAVVKIKQVLKLGTYHKAYRALFNMWLVEGYDAPALCKAIDRLIAGEKGEQA